jgi:hypothetical protein
MHAAFQEFILGPLCEAYYARMCLTTCRFCEKIYFGGNLTWIRFVFKLDIFKNNVRFGFILKEVCFNLIGIYFSINRTG